MVKLKELKKCQGLPLNTIVIAILVIIVLLVIIVFFTKQVVDKDETLDANDPTACQNSNPILGTFGYSSVRPVEKESNCDESNNEEITSKLRTGKENQPYCCGTLAE